MGIFKGYDIRGVYPTELFPSAVYKIAKIFVQWYRGKYHLSTKRLIKVSLGRDARLSSPALHKSFVKGLRESGVDVRDLGIVTTDELYFSLNHLMVDVSVMITASHNPKEYNGLKLLMQSPSTKEDFVLNKHFGLPDIQISYEDMQWRAARVSKSAVKKINLKKPYTDSIFDIFKKYFPHFVPKKSEKIIIDCAHGPAYRLYSSVIKRAGIRAMYINEIPDGNFPRRDPNPIMPGAVRELQSLVKKECALCGVAVDGDADRIIFIDENGKFIRRDFILALFSRYFLTRRNAGKKLKVVYNVSQSKIIAETVEKYGGIPIRGKTGHTFIKETMKKENAFLGGEFSGHFYFRDANFYECPPLAMLIVIALIRESGKKLSELVAPFEKYYITNEINIQCDNREEKLKKVEKMYSRYKKDYLDGLTVFGENFWFNLRPSNTEPLLRLVVEGDNKEIAIEVARRIQNKIENKIRNAK